MQLPGPGGACVTLGAGESADKPESKGPGHMVTMVDKGSRTSWNREEGGHLARKAATLQTPSFLAQVCSDHHIRSSCPPPSGFRLCK